MPDCLAGTVAGAGVGAAACWLARRHPSHFPRNPEVPSADDTDSEAQLRKQQEQQQQQQSPLPPPPPPPPPSLAPPLPLLPPPPPPGRSEALRAQPRLFLPALAERARRRQKKKQQQKEQQQQQQRTPRRRRPRLGTGTAAAAAAGQALRRCPARRSLPGKRAPPPTSLPSAPAEGAGELAGSRPRLGSAPLSPASTPPASPAEGHRRGPQMEKRGKRVDCPALPPGWKKEEVIRKSGLSAGKSDVYYFSPSGKKFRSKPQLARYLGNTVDLSSFDFRTGKMMPSKLQKNKQKLRNDSLNQNKGKPDLNTTLPIRQTASIFKQPVTKVTNHPNNKVKSDPQRVIEQPRQLFWEKRLQGLSASDVSEQIIKSMELPKGLQGVGPGNSDDTLLSAVASALHTSSAPITGQLSTAVEKNPAVWLNTSQPLCKAFIVTDEDIRKQEERVQQVRKKLEEALMADILSRATDAAEVDEVEMDNGEEA